MKKPASPNHSCLRTCVGHCAWGVSRVGSVVRGQVPGPIMSCSTVGWTGPDPICGWNFGRGLVTSCLEQAGLEKTKENRKKNLDLSSEGFPARRVVITSSDDSYHILQTKHPSKILYCIKRNTLVVHINHLLLHPFLYKNNRQFSPFASKVKIFDIYIIKKKINYLS